MLEVYQSHLNIFSTVNKILQALLKPMIKYCFLLDGVRFIDDMSTTRLVTELNIFAVNKNIYSLN